MNSAPSTPHYFHRVFTDYREAVDFFESVIEEHKGCAIRAASFEMHYDFDEKREKWMVLVRYFIMENGELFESKRVTELMGLQEKLMVK